MDKLAQIALTGGVFALLIFIHFAIDWIFQSHAEAMAKHNTAWIRAIHCAIYTVPFVPFMWWCGLRWYWNLGFSLMLFLSHFVEDTYIPVMIWAKFIRRPPEMAWTIQRLKERRLDGTYYVFLHSPDGKNDEDSTNIQCGAKTWRETLMMDCHFGKISDAEAQWELDKGGFVEFISSPLGKILMIAVDQIIHIAFLLPIAYMIVAKRAMCGL